MRRPRKQYNETDQESGGLVPSCKEYVSHSSVTATHQEPLGRGTIELYFGPSSDFALTRNLYREVSSRFNVSEPRSDEKEKEFLDELPIRHIFFGNPSSEEVSLSGGRRRSSSTITPFLQFGLAKSLLDRYLATYYNLAPFVPKRLYQEQLQLMFSSETSQDHDVEQKRVILLAIAIASQSTPHWRWGDTLVQIVENDRRDSVSIENIQLDLLMISLQFSAMTLSSEYLTDDLSEFTPCMRAKKVNLILPMRTSGVARARRLRQVCTKSLGEISTLATACYRSGAPHSGPCISRKCKRHHDSIYMSSLTSTQLDKFLYRSTKCDA